MNIQTDFSRDSQTPPDTIQSEDLFGQATTLTILHAGMTYTLRITRQGKLLLTK